MIDTTMFRCRVERKLLKRVSRVAEEIGTTPGEITRMLFVQVVKRRAIPFPVSADPDNWEGLLDNDRRNRVLRQLDDSEGW